MKRRSAELIARDPERFFHHDRVFLNNPVVMQGMGLAPLVVLATNGQNALMLAAAVALLLTPSRLLACLLSRLFPLREEHPSKAELEKKLLPRSILYSGSAALLTYRFGRVQESPRKALSKGVRITVGYSLLLLLLGCVREWLSAGTVFGHLLSRPILPMAGMPAGGFIVLGVLCAVWRTLAKKQKDYLTSEARGLMAVYRQREGEPQDEQ